jgi:hypothetical protein
MIKHIFERVNKAMFSRKSTYFIYILIVTITFLNRNVQAGTESINEQKNKEVERYKVAKLNIEEVSGVYSVTLWILLGSLIKIGISAFTI